MGAFQHFSLLKMSCRTQSSFGCHHLLGNIYTKESIASCATGVQNIVSILDAFEKSAYFDLYTFLLSPKHALHLEENSVRQNW
jgi:hypothetical protein